jgi:hypothetical protein
MRLTPVATLAFARASSKRSSSRAQHPYTWLGPCCLGAGALDITLLFGIIGRHHYNWLHTCLYQIICLYHTCRGIDCRRKLTYCQHLFLSLSTLLNLLATASQLQLPVHKLIANFASFTGHSQGWIASPYPIPITLLQHLTNITRQAFSWLAS